DVLAQVKNRELTEAEMIAGNGLNRRLADSSVEAAVLPGQVLGEIVVELVPARLRSKHDREGGIAGDIDLLQRVHLHCDAKAHVARVGEGRGFVTLARRSEYAAEVVPE